MSSSWCCSVISDKSESNNRIQTDWSGQSSVMPSLSLDTVLTILTWEDTARLAFPFFITRECGGTHTWGFAILNGAVMWFERLRVWLNTPWAALDSAPVVL